MTGFIFVYVTVGTEDEAFKIARALIEEKLAACVNMYSGMRSVYLWEGEIEEAREVTLIVKTRADLFDRVEERVKNLHSYACPCIVAFPILAGSPDFLRWIDESTKK